MLWHNLQKIKETSLKIFIFNILFFSFIIFTAPANADTYNVQETEKLTKFIDDTLSTINIVKETGSYDIISNPLTAEQMFKFAIYYSYNRHQEFLESNNEYSSIISTSIITKIVYEVFGHNLNLKPNFTGKILGFDCKNGNISIPHSDEGAVL
ncbi:MAG: hypothetical protein IKO41_05620 [Lachnospiraceae bacterium]|nr:hypothetical protein [Lachnospiraceae bacterium]